MGKPMLPRPTKPTVAGASSLLTVIFSNHFIGRTKRIHCCGYATIDSRLQKDLSNLLVGQPIILRTPRMSCHFMRSTQRGQHAQINQTALTAAKPFTTPVPAPAIFVEQILQFSIEIILVVKRRIHVLLAQNLTSDLQTFFF